MNVPNTLSIIRIGLIPVIVFSLFQYGWDVALLFFLLASAMDFLDGYFARKLNQSSALGANLDAAGDKAMMISIAFSLMVKFHIPALYIFLVLSRDIVIALSVGFMKFFVRRKKRITFPAKRSGKNVTVLQFITIIAMLVGFGFTKYLVYLTFLFSIWCLSDYWNEWKKRISLDDIKLERKRKIF